MTGEYIKEKRKALNLSQSQLAKLVGVGKNTIYNYESGAKIPDSKIPILELVLNPKKEVLNEAKEKTPQDNTRFEDLVAEKVYEMMKPEINALKAKNRELTKLVLGLVPVSEEILKKVSDIQNTNKY